MLAAHLNETVSNNTLVEAIWRDTFVTDDSLVQCISEIRKSIDDNDHKIIETFAKIGYRLNARMPAIPTGHAPRRPVKIVLIGVCVPLVAVAGFSALMIQQSDNGVDTPSAAKAAAAENMDGRRPNSGGECLAAYGPA